MIKYFIVVKDQEIDGKTIFKIIAALEKIILLLIRLKKYNQRGFSPE